MYKATLITGAICCMMAVAIGAFGAHALQSILEANGRLDTFDTGLRYHIFHGLGLLTIGFIQMKKPNKFFTYSAFLMFPGILIFSGSLYILSITNLTILGAITPIGGICFILAWIFASVGFYKVDH